MGFDKVGNIRGYLNLYTTRVFAWKQIKSSVTFDNLQKEFTSCVDFRLGRKKILFPQKDIFTLLLNRPQLKVMIYM